MTENEIVKQAIRCIVGACDETCKGYDAKESVCHGYSEVASGLETVLKDYEQYREIGTVEKIKEELDRLRNDNECQGLYFTLEERKALAKQSRELSEYKAIGTVEELQALKEKNEQIPIIHGKAELELHDKGIRNKTIDEFAERLKDRIVGMQMAELQGEDVCPCHETGEECKYMNQDIACQYCAREQTKKDINEIAEEMRGTT